MIRFDAKVNIRRFLPILLSLVFLAFFSQTGVFQNTVLNEVKAATSVGGTITLDTTWDHTGSPYHLDSDLIVDGATLTIDDSGGAIEVYAI